MPINFGLSLLVHLLIIIIWNLKILFLEFPTKRLTTLSSLLAILLSIPL